MENDDLPISVWSGSIMFGGIELKCHILSDGRRIIEEYSLVELFEAMGSGSFHVTEEEMTDYHKFLKD